MNKLKNPKNRKGEGIIIGVMNEDNQASEVNTLKTFGLKEDGYNIDTVVSLVRDIDTLKSDIKSIEDGTFDLDEDAFNAEMAKLNSDINKTKDIIYVVEDSTSNPRYPFDNYRVGGKDSNGKIIEHIIAQYQGKYIIYLRMTI